MKSFLKRKGCIHRFCYDVKIRKKLAILFVFFALIPLLVTGIASSYISQRYVLENEKNMLLQTMEEKLTTLDYFLAIYANKCEMLSNNLELQRLLGKNNENIYDEVTSYHAIEQIINQVADDVRYEFLPFSEYFRGDLKIEIFNTNQTLPSDQSLLYPIADYQEEETTMGNTPLYQWISGLRDTKNREYIAMERKLYNYQNGDFLGIIRMMIPVERIRKILDSGEKYHHTALFVDGRYHAIGVKEGEEEQRYLNYIANNNLSDGIHEIRVEKENIIAGVFGSSVSGWQLIYFTETDEIMDGANAILFVTGISVMMTIVFCAVFLLTVSKIITRRLGLLVEKTNCVRGDNLSVAFMIEGKDEIGVVDQNFNEMIGRVNQLIEQEYKAKLQKNRAVLELLQEQINPHLLYNTLSMIGYKAGKSEQLEIVQAVDNLIRFYKDILNRGELISPIRKELDMVEEYLSITRFVYELSFDTVIEIEDSLYNCWTIKLFLQPLVENALLHGIRPQGEGILCIQGYEKDGLAVFEVMDNGCGMSREDLEELNKICAGEQEHEKGYGLSNVVRRLRLFFGNHFKMHFYAPMEGGTLVRLSFPLSDEESIRRYLE
ncbi:sensor histidine kinase [Diplocloster agilis]|uniref:sensor histidine kinase n=1 Tax=Diplocloster agilis TaxID=2850323 RepID=UPI000820948F|nr:histidine kinase [Suonthocola fibrivorans]MCU6733269.1 histidine kinase [Suonthocola fibrivorans]SCI83321.1 Inner membrane protein ypdA [uncultured Clostridium sp.]